ncbi:MAG: hypothetical protein ACR2HG_11085 [Pyrinomonadaceae bacterium]
MRQVLLSAVVLTFFAFQASAQTADEIVSKYVKAIGGMEKIQAIKTLRSTGKFSGGGGFEAVVVDENKRPNKTREDFSIQGMTAISAYDGRDGWKIEPFGGKKDVESLSEEELKAMLDGADFDNPLINYKARNIKVEYAGLEPVDGTDAYKLKVTLPSGTVENYFMDTDYYVPIKIETKRTVRGTEIEAETILGDYKEVNGIYFPFSIETGAKGSPNKVTITMEKIEANVPIDDSRFMRPMAKTPMQQPGGIVEEDKNIPKTQDKKNEPGKIIPPSVKKPIS